MATQSKGQDEAETEEVEGEETAETEEEVTEQEPGETESEQEDDGDEADPDAELDEPALREALKTTKASLHRVIAESVKRKNKIRTLMTELETLKGKAAKDVNNEELTKLQARNAELEATVRGYGIARTIGEVISSLRLEFISPVAKDDFIAAVTPYVAKEFDLDDEAEVQATLVPLIKKNLKNRSHLLKSAKKVAPELDAKKRSTTKGSDLDDRMVEEIAKTMNINL